MLLAVLDIGRVVPCGTTKDIGDIGPMHQVHTLLRPAACGITIEGAVLCTLNAGVRRIDIVNRIGVLLGKDITHKERSVNNEG